jgi:hypothetical protein
MPVLCHTKEVISAYVPTGACLKLYSYLDVSKERAIFCDTDSVIYIQKCGQPPAVTRGDKLGDMTNELDPTNTLRSLCLGAPRTTFTEQ